MFREEEEEEERLKEGENQLWGMEMRERGGVEERVEDKSRWYREEIIYYFMTNLSTDAKGAEPSDPPMQ